MSRASAFHEKYKLKVISCKQQKHTEKIRKKQQNIKKGGKWLL
jgi:hypothetical protein